MERGEGEPLRPRGSRPATDGRSQAKSIRGPPRAPFVHLCRRYIAENGIDDPPRRLDSVLSGEERRIARNGVAEQALVSAHLVARRLLDERQLRRFADHRLSGLLHARAKRNPQVTREAQPEVVAGARSRVIAV
jgi:hypothetical protein